jgi:hypothetical protein
VSSALERARSKLPGLLIEGLVVFLGVAAALAGQAWFEERADRRIERELLANILTEASQNEERGQRFLERLREQRSALQDFARLLAAPGTDQHAESIVPGARLMLESYGTGVVSSALDDALESGNLRLIRDPNVRSILSTYRNIVRVLFERVDDHQDWTNREVRVFLLERGVRRDVGTSTPSRLGDPVADLADSPYFEALLHDQIYLHDEMEFTIERLLLELRDSVLARVESELSAL